MTTPMRWWFGAFVVAVFLAGTSVGVIVDRVWLLPRGAGVRPAAAMNRPAGQAPLDGIVDANMRRLRSRLQLTDAQVDSIRPMVESWQQRIAALQRTTRDELLREVDRLEQDVATVLTPEQRDRLSAVRGALLVPRPGRGGREDRGGPPRRGGPGPD